MIIIVNFLAECRICVATILFIYIPEILRLSYWFCANACTLVSHNINNKELELKYIVDMEEVAQ
jgi:hypothetical protein